MLMLGLTWVLFAAGVQGSEERSIAVARIDEAPVVDGEIGERHHASRCDVGCDEEPGESHRKNTATAMPGRVER